MNILMKWLISQIAAKYNIIHKPHFYPDFISFEQNRSIAGYIID